MQLKDFIIKCVVITLCVWLILYLFYPRYEFFDDTHRANKITGRVEYYSDRSFDKGWH